MSPPPFFQPLSPLFFPFIASRKKVVSSEYNAKAYVSRNVGRISNFNDCFLSISHRAKAKEVFIPFILQSRTPTDLPLPTVLINIALKLSLPMYLRKTAVDITAVPLPSAPPTAPSNQLFIRSTGTSLLIAEICGFWTKRKTHKTKRFLFIPYFPISFEEVLRKQPDP